MESTEFQASLDAWRLGKATQDEVERALRAAVKANPLLIPGARSTIDAYRQAGHIPVPFADRLRGIGRGLPDLPPSDTTLPWVPAAAAVREPEELPCLQTAPFYPWVPGKTADGAPGDATAATAAATAAPAEAAAETAAATAAESPAGSPDRTAPLTATPAQAPSVARPGAVGIGRTLADEYVLDSIVPGGDRGGMGVVFKARDLVKERAADPNPYVAIKVLNEEFKRHPESMMALQREYKRGLQLSHPNIVKVQACTHDGIDVFMVMELLEGRSLGDVIRATAGRGLPEPDALRTTLMLSRALGYAHRLRIVHSDFKPNNAFITYDGAVKILDFGIARALMQPVAGAAPVGGSSGSALTSAYASCEQLEGAAPDPRDDVYSLALVTYELYTGRHPFDRRDAVTARGAGLEPRPVASLSGRQWRTLRSALSFSRERRPADARVFGEGMTPRPRSVLLNTAGASALALLLLAAVLFAVNRWEHRRADVLAQELTSPDPAIADDAVARLVMTDRSIREDVLAADGAQSRVMAIYARQARAAFDPLQEHYDYLRARAILDGAKGLLSGYPPLVQYAASLERQRRLVLDRLGEAFERALASHTLLEDDGPSSLLAVRRVIAQIDPGDPRLNDGRVPLAFRDAAAAAWAKADLNLADRLVAEGLTFAPSDPGLSDVADRVKRRRAPQSGS